MRSTLPTFLLTALLVAACAAPTRDPESSPPPETEVSDATAQAGNPAPVMSRDASQGRELARKSLSDRERREARLQAAPESAAQSAAGAVVGSAAVAVAPPSHEALAYSRYAPHAQDRETYAAVEENGVMRVAESPVSTFSVDVDTGSYSNLRRMLKAGALPRQDAVRVEEMINYFDYGYAPPRDRGQPFAVHTELAPTPWNPKTQLLRIGLKGWEPAGELPPSNLVFLVDVSGSMADPDKLPLVKSSLRLLVNELGPRDTISLVVYAGASGVVLEPTAGDRKPAILAALDRLEAGGSTNGASGIQLAYAMAERGFIRGGINRVLLATDGDFNVGLVDFEQLKDLVEVKRGNGVALSTLGFGTGNYNDRLMEQLADAGNGNYTYVDGLMEARRALVQMRAATLQTIAKDVKIQVEFNPAVVAEYRLVGYENRRLSREAFDNDAIDAGEIGAGHSVTALYEVALRGAGGERIAPLRYGMPDFPGEARAAGEIAWLKLRYKSPDADASRLIERAITRADGVDSLAKASEATRFAAAVAGFGQVLRGGRYTGSWSHADALRLARQARGDDAWGWKGEFAQLVELAQGLSTHAAVSPSPEERVD